MKVVVDWTPREGNKDADRLAHGIVDGLLRDLEIKLDSSAIEWEVLPDALRMALEADSEYRTLKQESRLPDQRKSEEETGGKVAPSRSFVEERRAHAPSMSFSFVSLFALHCSFGAVVCLGASMYGLPMLLCSIALPEPSRLFSQLCMELFLFCIDRTHTRFAPASAEHWWTSERMCRTVAKRCCTVVVRYPSLDCHDQTINRLIPYAFLRWGI